MVQLSKDPKGWELEDFVAAHFASRGAYVEAGVTERRPKDILELDVVWTDYRKNPPASHSVEVKSGEVHLGDIFKFYGWTRPYGMPQEGRPWPQRGRATERNEPRLGKGRE